MPGDRITDEGQHQLEQAHHHQRGHAQLPGGHRRRVRVHAQLFEADKGRAQHQQRHADAGRRIQPQRHRGDVVAAGARRQTVRHQRVHQVADQHAESGAGEHAAEHHVGRELEDANQRHRDEAEDGQVVDHQAEEAVEITGDKPARARCGGCGGIHGGYRLQGRRGQRQRERWGKRRLMVARAVSPSPGSGHARDSGNAPATSHRPRPAAPPCHP
ncbi:hypothetical protein D3C71_1093200 [compost metagenome]